MRPLAKKILFPILRRWYEKKTQKVNKYSRHGIAIRVLPSVFHPGVFLSTNIFIEFLKGKTLHEKRILELGAGSGMISLFCAKQGALITATDVNPVALDGLRSNAQKNQLSVAVLASDLFENVDPNAFDMILINPPYYPKNPANDQEHAFYCGSNFEYFERLFQQLQEWSSDASTEILMILSEDCDLERITTIATSNQLVMESRHSVRKRFEKNTIYAIQKSR